MSKNYTHIKRLMFTDPAVLHGLLQKLADAVVTYIKYQADAGAQVVQIFDPQGRLLLFFGELQGDAPGLDLPAKVVIDYEHTALFAAYAAPGFQVEHLVIVTNQFGERKVSVFGFGHQK